MAVKQGESEGAEAERIRSRFKRGDENVSGEVETVCMGENSS